MKKITNLLLGIFIIFGFTLSVKANDEYKFKEIKLTSDEIEITNSFYWDLVKLNKNKDGFTAVGNSYDCQEKKCNVYNISMDGVVTKANLKYDYDTEQDEDNNPVFNYYEYIDVDENNHLVKYQKKNIGFYDPNKVTPNVKEITPVILDAEITYEEIYCDPTDNAVDYGVRDLKDMNENRICLIMAKDSLNNPLYGLVKEGLNPEVIVKPSKDYQVVSSIGPLLKSDRLKIDDDQYLFASKDGTIQKVNVGDLFPYVGVANIKILSNSKYGLIFGSYVTTDIYGKDYENRWIIDIPGATEEQWPTNAVFDLKDVINLKNGEFFIAEKNEDSTLEVKLYDGERQIVTDHTNIHNILSNIPILTYLKDNKVYFTDGKELLYSMDNTDNKYDWLFSFIEENNGTYYFKSGSNQQGGSNNYIYILSKDIEEKEVKEVKYEVLEGNNQVYNTKGTELLRFKFSIPFEHFKASGKVYLDGKLLDTSNYDVKEDNTIILFKSAYSKNLKDGKHTVKVTTDLGEVTATFTSIGNPQTLDKSIKMFGLFLASISGVYITCLKIRKTRKNN